MTLTAYLSLLSLGSSIQRRSSSDSFEREEQVLQLLEMDAALTNAEVDIVNAVSQHSAPAEEKGSQLVSTRATAQKVYNAFFKRQEKVQ